MPDCTRAFGALLYAELRRLSGYDFITEIMDYNAIQALKKADRESTLKLFQGSNYEVIQVLKTAEPEEAADYLVKKWEETRQASNIGAAAAIIMMNGM